MSFRKTKYAHSRKKKKKKKKKIEKKYISSNISIKYDTYLSPLCSALFSDGDVILVELPVLTTGLVLEGDFVKFATLFSVDFVRVGVVVL